MAEFYIESQEKAIYFRIEEFSSKEGRPRLPLSALFMYDHCIQGGCHRIPRDIRIYSALDRKPTSVSELSMDFNDSASTPGSPRRLKVFRPIFFFYEKMLSHVVDKQENVCVKIALDNGREEVLLLPALQWAISGEGRRVLVVVPDAESGDRCAAAIDRLGSGAGIGVCRARRDESNLEVSLLEGDPAASVLIGMVDDILALSGINLRDFGFLIVDGVDRLTELPADSIRRLCAALLPSWERRSVLACARFSVKAKNLAWDLADNPSEISIEGEVAKAQSVLKETWNVPAESKLKFLLGLIAREKPARLCVFCNIRDTANEVTRRLAANGISTDSILGPLLPERNSPSSKIPRGG